MAKKTEQVKKADQTKPVELAKKTEQVKKANQTKPVELAKKTEQVKKADQTKPVELAKKTEQVKKADQTKPVELAKKTEQVKKADQTKPVELAKKTEQVKKADQTKPVELAKKTEQVKKEDQAKVLAKQAEQEKLAILSKKKGQFHSIGRRKNALARVYIQTGEGKFFVNKRELKNYFTLDSFVRTAIVPLELVKFRSKINVKAFVKGGGISGQAGAVKLGLSRALSRFNPEWQAKFRSEGFLTRDSRVVERKKYGQKGARAKFQFSKR